LAVGDDDAAWRILGDPAIPFGKKNLVFELFGGFKARNKYSGSSVRFLWWVLWSYVSFGPVA
jgi:hypothetical protein